MWDLIWLYWLKWKRARAASNDLFRFTYGRNNTLSGNPIGFFFGWRPQASLPERGRYGPVPFRWTLDFWFEGWRPHYEFDK